eukprot:SAG11_NODE_1818_length_4215_cov_1.631438_2_plen_158_part_00
MRSTLVPLGVGGTYVVDYGAEGFHAEFVWPRGRKEIAWARSLADYTFGTALGALTMEQLLLVCAAMMLERPILLVAASKHVRSCVALAATALLAPWTYPHTVSATRVVRHGWCHPVLDPTLILKPAALGSCSPSSPLPHTSWPPHRFPSCSVCRVWM